MFNLGSWLTSVGATVAVGLGLAVGARIASAATEAQKRTALNAGLEALAQRQQADGRWLYGMGGLDDDCAATAYSVQSFLTAGYTAGSDAIVNGTNYGDVVGNGLDYIFSRAQQVPISVQMHGNPDMNGNGLGIKFVPPGGNTSRDTMVTGSVLPTLIATGTPDMVVTTGALAGRTYQDIVQDTVDYLAWGQVDGTTPYRGGWRYTANYSNSDQSCTPYPINGMNATRLWGIDAPAFVETELDYYLAALQNPDGGAAYMAGGALGSNVYRTGAFLSQKYYSDDTTTETAVQAAINYINTQWQTTANSTFNGNFGNLGAMWFTFLGLSEQVGLDDTTFITNLRSYDPAWLDAGDEWNWSEDYIHSLVDTQYADGHWAGYGYWTDNLATAWSVSMLNATTELPEPASLVMLALGGLVVLPRRRR